MVKGANKGASFERRICKELSLWVSRGKRRDIFWRSAMSGGRATVAMKGGVKLSAQAGDVSAVDRLGGLFIETFLVECKHYRSLDIISFVKRRGTLFDFWMKLRKEADRHHKIPFLIARQNNYPIFVLTTKHGLVELGINKVEAIYPRVDARFIWYEDFLECRPKRERVRL